MVMEKYSVGQSLPRTEDPKLVCGAGRFTDDVNHADQAHAYVMRSPFAHGTISTLDTKAAQAAPGVLMVITSAELDAEGIGRLPCAASLVNRDGSPMHKPVRPSLAIDRVRYRGEAVAVVIATSVATAKDAAELIEFDVSEEPTVVDARAALEPGAPRLHDDVVNNLTLDWETGDTTEVDAIFATAHHVTRLDLRNNRVVVSAMEPRAALAEYDAESSRYTLHVPSQGVFGLHNGIARVMGVAPEQVRILTNHVGGSFGMKGAPYPEYSPILLAARELGRPVKWCDERSDSFVSDQQGRDSWAEAAIALDEEGHLLAGRVISHANVGAYLTGVGPNMQTNNIRKNFPGPYRLPVLHARTYAVFSNTVPIGAYRGAGRPEGVYYMERLLDTAAAELGMDRIEIRRRNLVGADEIPYLAASGLTYDSGNFPAVLDAALSAADWSGFDVRYKRSGEDGKLRGRGLACYLEVTGPQGQENGGIRFEDDGGITMLSGTLNYGQGHNVTFAQILSDRLGIPVDQLNLVQGDSDQLVTGGGTGGSKSVMAAGTAFLTAADQVVAKAIVAAGEVLETAPEDIEFEAGALRVAGTDRAIGLAELASEIRARGLHIDGEPASLDVNIAVDTPPSAFPNGCHIAEVEVDAETGEVSLERYTVVDDFGTLINPMLVEGQVHGGVVQGIGQALQEDAVYGEDGQLLSGSYMDYTLPRAEDIPNFSFHSRPVPATTNILGAKGCGEAGTSGALPAVMNAVVDALRAANGTRHIDMPATAQRVWQALNL